MLRTVKVYGHLAEHCGQSVFEAVVRTPAEAIRFLLCNFPDLRGLMRDGYYKVAATDFELDLADHPEQLHFPLSTTDIVRVIPVITGAGGGVGKILGGAALISAAILLAPTGAGFLGLGSNVLAGTFTLGAAASTAIGGIGAALVLGGTAQLISPQPPSLPEIENDPRNPANNFGFSGIQQTAREGSTIPVVYGETIVGSIIISQGLNVDQE